MELTEEERRLQMPDRGDGNTVFADGVPAQFSISEIVGEKRNYGVGVMLDSNLFKGVRTRDWDRVLSAYVYEKLAGAELTMYDEAGNSEIVYLARENDRVKKDGAKNPHKVLGKLAAHRGDAVRAKAIVQLSEVLETSRYKETTDEHSHQWMDENGWIIRTAYLQDKDGRIYEATLNIADGRDRKILYEVNRVHQIDKIKNPGEHTASDNSQRFRYQKPKSGRTQSGMDITDNVETLTENGQRMHMNGDSGESIYEDGQAVKKKDIQNSFSPNTDEEAASEQPSLAESLPTKAKDYLAGAERKLMDKISEVLSIPRRTKDGRSFLQSMARQISEEYLHSGQISAETADQLFEDAYARSVELDTTFYDEYKHIKDHLRTTPVIISEMHKTDIPDYGFFKRKAFGTLRIVSEGGLPVDTAYMELHGMAPELFPGNITHPADQLTQMYEVARSIRKVEYSLDQIHEGDAENFRQMSRYEFGAAIDDIAGELRQVKRYSDEVQAEREAREAAKNAPEMSHEEVAALYREMKAARRTYEKVAAKHLLTNHDEVQVGRLLRGGLELENLDPARDNVKGITAVYEAKAEYEALAKQIRDYNKRRKARLRDLADDFLETANDWKDKKMGILYARETMERNIRDIVPDEALAERIITEYFTPVHAAQAAATRMKNDYRARVRALELSRNVEEGNAVSEAHDCPKTCGFLGSWSWLRAAARVSPIFCGKYGGLVSFSPAHVRGKTELK